MKSAKGSQQGSDDAAGERANNATLSVGWVLFIVGVIGVTAWGVYEFVIDASISPAFKFLLGSLYLGLAVLFVGVLRQRLSERKTDKYNDVEI